MTPGDQVYVYSRWKRIVERAEVCQIENYGAPDCMVTILIPATDDGMPAQRSNRPLLSVFTTANAAKNFGMKILKEELKEQADKVRQVHKDMFNLRWQKI